MMVTLAAAVILQGASGPRFIVLPNGELPKFRNAEDQVLKPDQVRYREFVSQREIPLAAGSLSHVRILGMDATVRTRTALADHPSVMPTLLDDTLRDLRKRYLGKRLYFFGNALPSLLGYSQVDDDLGLTFDEPVRVVGIYRCAIKNFDVLGEMDSGPDGWGNLRTNPYLFVVRPLKRDRIAGLMIGDQKQLLNVFTSHSAARAMRGLSARQVQRLREGEDLTGMSKSLVARVTGWPNLLGDQKEMLRRSVWSYNGFNIHFDAQGRVKYRSRNLP